MIRIARWDDYGQDLICKGWLLLLCRNLGAEEDNFYLQQDITRITDMNLMF